MKKTGIAAMMLSTAIAVSSIAVPVCAAPGQTAESAQMQEQPQTETEPAKSISDEDFAKLLDFIKEKWDAGELDNAEDIKAAISEGEKEFGVSLDESTRTTLASALQQLNGIGLNHETVIALAQKMYESYGDTLVENLSDALQEQLAGPLGKRDCDGDCQSDCNEHSAAFLAGPEAECDRFPEPCFPERGKLTPDFPDIDS